MTDQVFPDLPQTPPPEPPADPPAQEEPAEALTPAQEMADALSAPEVETPDVSDSPFCRAMDLIAGGLAVTGVTLNFWNLDVLLPLVGTFCLLVGFRALRRVNGFLRAGYVCACLHMLLLFVELGQNAAVFRETAAADMVSTALAFGSAAVQLVLLFCLWQGLLDMQRDAGITPPAAPAAGALLLWYILLYVAAALFASLSLLLGAYLVWYFYLVVRLKKLSKSMAAQGCAIEPVKERFSNHKLVGSLLTVLAVVIACGILFFGSYRMDWTPKEASTDAQVIEAHERLLALGYPESELNDLSYEDLLTCLRAERVLIKECTGSAYINYSNKPQTNDAFHLTIVAVQRPFDRLFVACHFRWDDGVRFTAQRALRSSLTTTTAAGLPKISPAGCSMTDRTARPTPPPTLIPAQSKPASATGTSIASSRSTAPTPLSQTMARTSAATSPAPSPTTSTSSPNSKDYSIMSTKTAASSTP